MSFGNNKMPPPSSGDFKKPPTLLTVGNVGGKGKFKESESAKSDSSRLIVEGSAAISRYEDVPTNSYIPAVAISVQKSKLVSRTESDSESGKQMYSAQKCPYDEPPWGSQPKVEYRLSILKSGTIIGVTKLLKSSFVIGRHQDSDLIMEHPSISRFHAVLQYRRPDPHATEPAKRLGGFYLFDLGSTHGTQVNRQLINAKSYRRLRVGHHLRFGFSSRTFILEGPVEDEEAESELSVSEIIELRKERKEKWSETLEAETAEKEEAAKKQDEEEKTTGINWGMREDAIEDEESPVPDMNPFALGGADGMNEQLYLDDPKKTLRGWFEREGYELEYRVEERGSQQFLCRVELPIDTGKGSAVVVEASVKGRKKEAVVQCALEACRILDRYGELRKAWHGSRAKKNKKNWKEDNYYDSDEDEFLDRTGDLANKREQRKARLENKVEQVETYDSLKEKLAIAENAIKKISESLEKSKAIEAANKASGDAVDTLDSFMKQLKAGNALDKAKRSQLRLELARLLTERIRLIRLVNIAKPTELPPLRPMSVIAGESSEASLSLSMGGKSGAVKSFGPMVGAIRGRKRPLTEIPAKVMRRQMADKDNGASSASQADSAVKLRAEIEEGEDEGDAIETQNLVNDDRRVETEVKQKRWKSTPSTTGEDASRRMKSLLNDGEILLGQNTEKGKEKVTKSTEMKEHALVKFKQLSTTTRRRTIGPTLPPGMLQPLCKETNETVCERASQKASASNTNKPSGKPPTLNAAIEKIRESSLTTREEHLDNWVPPAGQTGDGRTRLNDKFGY